MRWFFTILLIAAAIYAVFVAFLYFRQDGLIYPAPDGTVQQQPWYEEAVLKTSDGLELRSFYRPAEIGKPTAVFFHGNGGSLMGSIHSTRSMADAGYGLLLVEYRGYGGNAGVPSEQGLYADGRAAIQWLADQGVDPDSLIVMGNSLGTGVAIQMTIETDPAALVLSAPFTSLPDAVGDALPYVPGRLLVRGEYGNLEKLPDITAPILILHGTADTLISIKHGERLAQVGAATTFVPFEGLGHNLIFDPAAQQVRDEWLADVR